MSEIENNCSTNTNTEIWRRVKDDYYSPSIHATKEGNIGINVGGLVIVLPVEEWHKLAFFSGKSINGFESNEG